MANDSDRGRFYPEPPPRGGDIPEAFLSWLMRQFRRISTSSVLVASPVSGYTKWRGKWATGVYQQNDMVMDFPFTMIALRETSDRAKPVASGTPVWASEYYGVLTFGAPLTAAQSLWVTGNEVTFPHFTYIKGYRWYCPDISGTFQYEIWVTDGVTLTQLIAPTIPATAGWIEEQVAYVIPAGTKVSFVLVVRLATPPNTFSAKWNTKNTNGTPNTGEATFQNSETEIYFHHTDADGLNQQTNLTSVSVGAILTIGTFTFTVLNIDDRNNHTRYTIGPNQGRPPENLYTIGFSWGAGAPLPYVKQSGFYSQAVAEGIARGFSGVRFVDAVYDDAAYGIDILIRDFTESPDWEMVAYSGMGLSAPI